MADQFKYVIQTELKLAPGAVSKLLRDIKTVDNLISRQNIGNISLNARISSSSITAIQKEIGAMRQTIKLSAKLDKDSIASFKRELAVLVNSAKSNVQISANGNSTTPARSAVQNSVGVAQRRLGARLSDLTEADIKKTNQLALADQRAARSANLLADAELKSARALEVSTRAKERAARLSLITANIALAESKQKLSAIRAVDIASQTVARNEKAQAKREGRVLGSRVQQQSSSQVVQIPSQIKVLEAKLLENAIPLKQKTQLIEQLTGEYKKLAMATGQNIPKSFLFTDEAGNKLRTTVKEFTSLGRVIDKGDRSFRTMAGNVARNTAVYSVMSAGFAAVAASIGTAVNAMAQFESQFIKIQNITDQRNADANSKGEAQPYSNSGAQSKRDIFNIGKKYGLNPIQDVMPIYTDIIKRADIAKNANDAKRLTQLVVRAGVATGGNDIQGDDLQRLGKDFTGIYAQMFDVWSPDGVGDKALRKMSDFIDSLAKMSSSGADIDKSMDAIADLVPYVTGSGKLDLNFLSSIVSTAQHTMTDSSGSEIANILKMMFNNLTDSDGAGSTEARRILGTNVEMSLQQQLDYLAKRVSGDGAEKMNEGQLGAFVEALASNSGKGGVRNAQFSKIIKTLPDAIALKDASLSSQGKAEEMAIKYSKSLRGEWQKLLATMQELSVNLGDSGVLYGLKTMVKALNEVASAVSTVLGAVSKLGNVLPSIFGEQTGGAMNGFVSNVLMASTAIAGGRFAYNKLIKKGGAVSSGGSTAGSGIANIASTAMLMLPWGVNDPTNPANKKKLAEKYSMNRSLTALNRPNGGNGSVRVLSAFSDKQDPVNGRYYRGYNPYSRISSNASIMRGATRTTANIAEVATISKAGRAGNAISNGLNAAWLFATFRKGPGAVTGAGATTGILSKVGSAFSKMLPLLVRFGALLGRLSIIGGVLTGAWAIGKLFYNRSEKQKDKEAEKFNESFGTPSSATANFTKLDRLKALLDEGNTFSGGEATGYRYDRQKMLQSYSGMSELLGGDPALIAKSQEYLKLIDELKDSGIKDMGAGAGNFEYRYQDYITQTREKDGFSLFDETYDEFKLRSGAISENTGVLGKVWEEANKGALNYANTISIVTAIQERLAKVTTAQNIESSLNSTRFMGAEDSSGYISGELTNVQRSMSLMNNDYKELKNQKDLITDNILKNQTRLTEAQDALMSIDGGSKKISEIQEAFNSAKEAGSASTFSTQYEALDSNPESQAIHNYAKSLADSSMSSDALEGANKSIDDITNSITQQISTLKQLQVAYVVASSGMGVFEGALKRIKSSVADAQTTFNLAEGYDNQKAAMENMFSSMAGEARMYQEQLDSAQKTINSIVSSNPHQDFSVAALYSPTSELSAEQNEVKQLTETTFDTKANQNASLEALHSQIDAMKELVLNSDKYKSMWESVSERIELSKDLVKQLGGLTADRSISGGMGELTQAVTGKNKNEYMSEQATNRRDSYLDITQQIKKSFVTYGQDADKLKEALAEIKGSYTDKIKAAFLDPLSEIVNNDMQTAADTLKESAETYQSTVDLLNQILQQNLTALTSVVSTINGADSSSVFDTASSEQNAEAQAHYNAGIGKLVDAWENQNKDGFLGRLKTGISGIGEFALGLQASKQQSVPVDPMAKYANIPEQYRMLAYQSDNKEKLSTYNGSTGQSNVSWNQLANKNLKVQTKVTAEELDAYIASAIKRGGYKNSIMEGQGQNFIEAANTTGLDPVFLMALAGKESGWGTGNIARDKNAVYSIGASDDDPSGKAYQYKTIRDGIIEGAKWIAEKYVDIGQDSVYKMGIGESSSHKYNSNAEWVAGVSQIMAQFGNNAITGDESTRTTNAISQNGLTALIAESKRLSESGDLSYKQVGGEFTGSYQDFIKRALADCSQFVQEMYENFLGIKLPRTAAEQFKTGKSVEKNDIQAGDLLFFNTTGEKASHVGISTGGSKFMHMGSTGDNSVAGGSGKGSVKEGDLNSSYWSSKFDGARRIDGVGTAGLPVGMGDQTEALKLQQALEEMLKSASVAIKESFTEQGTNLISQKDIIKNNYSNNMTDFVSNMGVNGQGKPALSSYTVESARDSYAQVMTAMRANQDFLKNSASTLSRLGADANDLSKTKEERTLASTQYNSLKELLNDGKFVKSIETNTKHLQILADRYAAEAAKDPTRNATVASQQIQSQSQLITEINRKGKTGSVQYYDAINDSNQMYSNYMTTEKKVGMVQEHFDNTGNEYGQLASLKQISFGENVGLLFKQMSGVAKVLAGLTEGTNNWHVVLEDAVALQEKIVDLENKKTETAKRYFELTSKGVNAYVNARAYTQNRDVRGANDNQKVMTEKYNSTYRDNPNSSYTEGLVSLQAITEAYDKVQQQIEEYRTGIVGAFRAGVLGISEYIKKINELRNVQEESNNQAIEMKGSIESTFQNSLSGALKSGFEGSFDAQGEFLNSIKSGISSTIADQMSTVVLTQSGLMDSVNGIISKLVTSMTTGDPNDAVNLFNNNDIGKLLDTEMAKFLPLIQQITDSTKGMFNIMKDEVFNAPSGFKVDNALYEAQKPLTYSDVMGSLPVKDTNEAGAPTTSPSTSGSTIVLPPTTTPIGTGITKVINEVVRPIESIGGGSAASPIAAPATKTINPVAEILKGIATFKDLYNDDGKGAAGDSNKLLNSEADKLREQLKVLAPEIAAQIGDGKTGMSLEKMTEYLASQDLSAYDMTVGIDGVSAGISGVAGGIGGVGAGIGSLKEVTASKLDSMIGGISGVVAAVNAMRTGSSSTSTSSSSTNSSTSSSNSSSGSSYSYTSNPQPLDPVLAAKMKAEQDAVISTPTMEKMQEAVKGMFWNGTEWVRKYHTGGIAGIMNFANKNKLSSGELQTVLQTGETVFQAGQIGSLVDYITGGSKNSGSSGAIEINVNIAGNATGIDSATIKEAIADGVQQGLSKIGRQTRLNNLEYKGVSY